MPRPRRTCALLLAALTAACLVVTSCSGRGPTPTAPVDPRARETEVAVVLAATLTAKAPPTPTPTASATRPAPTAAPTPSPTVVVPTIAPPVGDLVAHGRLGADLSANVVLSDEASLVESYLTHFVEPQNLCDLGWSADGEWLVLVSAHDFMHSRANERNILVMRSDGTGLRMVTGDYTDPDDAQGPYVTLRGQVVGGNGPSLVSAEGVAAPVATDETGAFELVGVPVGARWARAVNPGGEHVLQGDIDLTLSAEAPAPVTIEVRAEGRGWTRASLAPDGSRVAGVEYAWSLDEAGEQQQTRTGYLLTLASGALTVLEVPEGYTLSDLAWSPLGDRVVGTLSGEEGAALWAWDAAGASVGEVYRLENPDDVIYTLADPAWSPDGAQLAVVRRDWNWWGEEKRRANILVLPAGGGEPRVVVESAWGRAAEHPSWTTDGARLYYQVVDANAESSCAAAQASIWRVRVDGAAGTAVPWRDDGASILPAIRPLPKSPAAPTPAPSGAPGAEATPGVEATPGAEAAPTAPAG